jgi:hypothetical protein
LLDGLSCVDDDGDAAAAAEQALDYTTDAEFRCYAVDNEYASRFVGDEGLEVKDGNKAGFYQLRFGNGSRDAEQRFAGKEDRAFWQGQNLTREAEASEIVEEAGVDMTEYRQYLDTVSASRRNSSKSFASLQCFVPESGLLFVLWQFGQRRFCQQ